jgi:predicted secreted protein
MRRFAVIVVLVLLASGCSQARPGSPSAGEQRRGEFTIEDTDIRVAPGESFTIAVQDNASVGDDWSLSAKPDEGVVTVGGDHYVADSTENVDGGGGTRYFEFEARSAGSTSVELRNCYRGCADPEDEHRYEIAIEVG